MFKNKNLDVSLPSSLVNIDEKTRSNLFSWRGQFSPQLIEQLILNYAKEDSVVFDPFLGSGTVVYESLLLGLEAYGSEINPAAMAFAKVYELANYPKDGVFYALSQVEEVFIPLVSEQALESMEAVLLKELSGATSTVHKTILMALVTGIDFGAKKLTEKRALSVWSSLHSTILNLPNSQKKVTCYQADSRKVPIDKN
ncbi:hypothetical protein D0815_24920, partial [Vibrio parahaemolyticus]|nr:hypothetical protein [Vibrio parahaemolyticus]